MSDFVREAAAAYGERRKMTVREFYLAAEKGVFRDDERLELIDGEVLQLSPQRSRHSLATENVREELRRVFPSACIRDHSPLTLDDLSEPEPDVLVAAGPRRRYVDRHPSPADVLLVVEVADTTLRKDRHVKSELYARFGIPEYWILDLNAGRLEVYREPRLDASGKGSYASSEVLSSGGGITPFKADRGEVAVSDLLPL